MGNYGKAGYAPKPNVKLGTKSNPLMLVVNSVEREAEINSQLTELNLYADIRVDADAQENLLELEAAQNRPVTQVFEKTPQRNDPCSCGSGKKYKKCCG